MKINLLSLVTFLTLLISCGGGDARRDVTTTGPDGWIVEGWGGPPEQRSDGKTPKNTTPKEWFYMKFFARASDKAIKQKSPGMMMSTCREAARLQGASDVVKKMVGETLESASGVSDGQSTGLVIVSQSSGIVQGVGVYDCKANGPGNVSGDASKENWEECICVIHARYEGGRDAMVGRAKAIEKSN